MSAFISFTIIGIITGAVYAVAASGLVVTYTTSGIFNFAHGATGMVMAFLYWQVRVHSHVPAPLALILVLFVAAPLFGAGLERFLIRNLKVNDVGVYLVVTLGILLAILGLSNVAWPNTESRTLQPFFGADAHVKVGPVNVSYHQIVMLVTALLVAGFLRYLLFQTRAGIAMRAVVDDRDLAALNGAKPLRTSQLSWAVGSILAALAGILLAPQVGMQTLGLSFLVIDAFAAAMLGRLTSLPLTFLGAVILGVGDQYVKWKLGDFTKNIHGVPNEVITSLSRNLPTLFLFGVLLFMPQVRLKVGRTVGAVSPRVPSLRQSTVGSGALVVVCAVISLFWGANTVNTLAKGLGTAIILLSLTLLAGYGGQISLCQGTFVGIGAFVFGKVAATGNPAGLLVAAVVCALVGALIALPALRLQGLYLALATLAFARLADGLFFGNSKVLSRSSLNIHRISVLGVNVNGTRANFLFLAVCFGLMANLVLAIRRGPFGRLLGAMRDSPAACATLGLDLTVTKLGVFALSAAMAGVGGALLGSSRTIIVATDYQFIQSLVLLLLVTIGGANTVTGALFGGLSFVLPEFINPHIPEKFQQLSFIGTGLGAIGLASNPIGVAGQISLALQPVRKAIHKALPMLGLGDESDVDATGTTGGKASTEGDRVAVAAG